MVCKDHYTATTKQHEARDGSSFTDEVSWMQVISCPSRTAKTCDTLETRHAFTWQGIFKPNSPIQILPQYFGFQHLVCSICLSTLESNAPFTWLLHRGCGIGLEMDSTSGGRARSNFQGPKEPQENTPIQRETQIVGAKNLTKAHSTHLLMRNGQVRMNFATVVHCSLLSGK